MENVAKVNRAIIIMLCRVLTVAVCWANVLVHLNANVMIKKNMRKNLKKNDFSALYFAFAHQFTWRQRRLQHTCCNSFAIILLCGCELWWYRWWLSEFVVQIHRNKCEMKVYSQCRFCFYKFVPCAAGVIVLIFKHLTLLCATHSHCFHIQNHMHYYHAHLKCFRSSVHRTQETIRCHATWIAKLTFISCILFEVGKCEIVIEIFIVLRQMYARM